MKKHIRSLVTFVVISKKQLVFAAALAAVGSIAAVAVTAAHADNGIVLSNYDWSYSNVSFTVTDKAVSNGGVKGKIQVRGTLRNGLSKAQMQSSEGCLVAANDNKPGHGKACGHIKIGTVITNSGTLITTGRFGTYLYKVKSTDKFFLINGQWYKGKCGNKVWINRAKPPMPPLPLGKVEEVVDFTYRATVTVTAQQRASVSASASCSTNNSAAAAAAQGTGYGYAHATASATARTSASAVALASASAQNDITVNQSDSIKEQARGDAQVKLQLSASAVVSCSSTPSGPTTPTTPTTTQTTTTTPTPVPQACTYNWHFQKGDPYTIYVDVAATSTPFTTFTWGDGTSAGGTYSGIHTYPTPAPGPAGSGVTYPLRVSAKFNDGSTHACTSAQGDPFVAAPPPNGNPGPPPAP